MSKPSRDVARRAAGGRQEKRGQKAERTGPGLASAAGVYALGLPLARGEALE